MSNVQSFSPKIVPFITVNIPEVVLGDNQDIIIAAQGESCFFDPASKVSSALIIFNSLKKTASEIFTVFNDRKIFIYSSFRDADNEGSFFVEYPLLPKITTNHLRAVNLDELYLLTAHKGEDNIALALEYVKQECAVDTLVLRTNGALPLYFYLIINYFVMSFCKAVVFQVGEEKISLK